MTRKQFVNYTQTRKGLTLKKCVVKDLSITDPTFAQSGRQMLTNPLNIEYRMKYPAGTPLNKNNPMRFNEYDKLYPDNFKAIREAQSVVSSTESKLRDASQQINKNKQQPKKDH